jgi:hypothetical protein
MVAVRRACLRQGFKIGAAFAVSAERRRIYADAAQMGKMSSRGHKCSGYAGGRPAEGESTGLRNALAVSKK